MQVLGNRETSQKELAEIRDLLNKLEKGGGKSRKKVNISTNCLFKYKGVLISERPIYHKYTIFLSLQISKQKLPVQPGNMCNGNPFWAFNLASACVGAVSKAQFVHFSYHAFGPAAGFNFTLWQ